MSSYILFIQKGGVFAPIVAPGFMSVESRNFQDIGERDHSSTGVPPYTLRVLKVCGPIWNPQKARRIRVFSAHPHGIVVNRNRRIKRSFPGRCIKRVERIVGFICCVLKRINSA